MTITELVKSLTEVFAACGYKDMEVSFSDYEHHTLTDEDREVNLSSVFEQDGKVYITDAPWWECP